MEKIVYLLLFLICCACSSSSKDTSDIQDAEALELKVPDENTMEGQAHRLLAATFPQARYETFHFGAVHIGVRANLHNKYNIMEQQGLCTIQEKKVSNIPFCVVQLTPKALEYMQEGSKDSLSSRLGMEYKARFKLFDKQFTGIVDLSEIPAYNATQVRYSIERTNITPFTEAYLSDSGKKVYDASRLQDTVSAYMQKTTKGWRLVKN